MYHWQFRGIRINNKMCELKATFDKIFQKIFTSISFPHWNQENVKISIQVSTLLKIPRLLQTLWPRALNSSLQATQIKLEVSPASFREKKIHSLKMRACYQSSLCEFSVRVSFEPQR